MNSGKAQGMTSSTNFIDLRSDTVTQPTEGMLQAISDAEVGDDVIDIDPTLRELEIATADLLGKEAAIFMPTGTMSNQIAIRLHCRRGTEFICEADCHIHHYEQGAYAQLSGLVAKTITGQGGVLRVSDVQDSISPENEHFLRTTMLCLENTHNRWGGRIQPQEEVREICYWAHRNGLSTHLDGARLWNTAVATGKPLNELAEPFDSISVCFSKGLGAPVGSALVGNQKFIDEARRERKLFGGGMRQAGVLGAAALYAIHHHQDRIALDHENAQRLGIACQQSKSLRVREERIDTNIILCDVHQEHGTASDVVDLLASNGIKCLTTGKQTIRLVTHLNVSEEDTDRACEILRTI